MLNPNPACGGGSERARAGVGARQRTRPSGPQRGDVRRVPGGVAGAEQAWGHREQSESGTDGNLHGL